MSELEEDIKHSEGYRKAAVLAATVAKMVSQEVRVVTRVRRERVTYGVRS